MRTMRIEDIWGRRDAGEPPPDPQEDPETYIRHTKVRHRDHREGHNRVLRPDGKVWKEHV